MDALAKTVSRALAVYGTPAFTEMIENCMAQDLSWKVSDSIYYAVAKTMKGSINLFMVKLQIRTKSLSL